MKCIDINKLNKIADKAIEEDNIDKLVAICSSTDIAGFERKNANLDLLSVMDKCSDYLQEKHGIYFLFADPPKSKYEDLEEMGLI